MRSYERFRLGAVPKGLIILFCVIGLLLSVGGALLVGTLGGGARDVGQQNTCRSNMRNLTIAANQYEARMGRYPGYMNVLLKQDGNPYLNSSTNEPEPVSWAVELLADLDRIQVYEAWRNPTPLPAEMRQPRVEDLICPGDPQKDLPARLSYVVNSGMRDAAVATPANTSGGAMSAGMPRDWKANGMFFDYYSDDRLVKKQNSTRGPMIVMRSGEVRDKKSMTIMFTENLEATTYAYEAGQFPNGISQTETAWGCVWGVGSVMPGSGMPVMTPSQDLQRPNEGVEKTPHQPDYKYCRPSSKHIGGFNVGMADGSVRFMSDKISYLVYAKLMAGDDAGAKIAGTQTLVDPSFRMYQLNDSDLLP